MTQHGINPIDHAYTLVTQAEGLQSMMVILHSLKQKQALLMLLKLRNECPLLCNLLTGVIGGILITNPVLLREHLARKGIDYSYEQSRNLFRFLKRLIIKVKTRSVC